ncbi:DUF3530 family protein [Shewanella sp. UCD-KL12]|uniref:DUF3530 family protein n=1 Tax=Shewanella sp. UCD-KL12 TaxID=1917163 RepID=UPI0009F8CE25|nr:DUF3530 family protein [Shewanella sp. UCD-KL12]
MRSPLSLSLLILVSSASLLICIPSFAADPETNVTNEQVEEKKVDKHSKYDYLPQEEVIEITVGQQQSEILVKSWSGKKKLGAAILFATPGMGADGAGLNAYLRRELTRTGWATIAITPPKKVSTPNFATQPEEVAKAGEGINNQKANEATKQYSEEVWKDIREKQTQFVTQTMSQLDAIGAPYPGKRLLITSGQGAGLAISMISNNLLPKPDILVLINPYMKMKEENQALAKMLAQLEVPILDIQSEDGHRASYATVKDRAELSPQNAPYRYSQQRLALNLNNETAWNTTLKLIEGFAQRISKR